jgi:hypothetical protein
MTTAGGDDMASTLGEACLSVSDRFSDTVYMLGVHPNVHLHDMAQCRVFVGPCEGSVRIDNCEDCIITVACRHFRASGCVRCTFFIHCTMIPAIDNCHDMVFAPFNGSYPQLEVDMHDAGLTTGACNHRTPRPVASRPIASRPSSLVCRR